MNVLTRRKRIDFGRLITLSPHVPIPQIPTLLRRNVKRLRGGLAFKARRLLYHSSLGLEVNQLVSEALPGERVLNVRTTYSQKAKWLRGGLAFKARRLLHHSSLGLELNLI